MKAAIVAVMLLLCGSYAETSTLYGQQTIYSGQVKYGTTLSKTLYVLTDKYMVDSGSGVRFNLDSSTYSVGAEGASSFSIAIQNAAGVSQQSSCELSYQLRCTDIAQCGTLMTFYGQYKTVPAGWSAVDTNWTATGYLWDSTRVILTHHVPLPTSTAAVTRRVNFYPSGDNLRVNITRTNVGPGDTVILSGMGVRCR